MSRQNKLRRKALQAKTFTALRKANLLERVAARAERRRVRAEQAAAALADATLKVQKEARRLERKKVSTKKAPAGAVTQSPRGYTDHRSQGGETATQPTQGRRRERSRSGRSSGTGGRSST